MKNGLLGFVLVLLSATSWASGAVKPFQEVSLGRIAAERVGHPFLLLLWSIDCPPCMQELDHLQDLSSRFSYDNVVLVSTDGPAQSTVVRQTLESYELNHIDSWIFADSYPERLRFHIDSSWFGELPRAYFYDAQHQRTAHSGVLSKEMLERWFGRSQDALRPLD